MKALLALYSKEAYLSALRHFTERFKSQLTKMATSDKDLPIRVAVIGVLEAIDAHGLLDDDQRKTLCMLIFDEELKVRKAVSGFVHNVWNEAVQEKLVGRRGGDKQKDKARAGVKCLATLLIEWSHALEELNGGMEESSQEEDTPSSRKPREIASLVSGANQQGRMILCVEALWSEIPVISEWETILDHLLLDHSGEVNDGATSQSSPMKRRRAAKNKNTEDDEGVEELWRLTDDEESVLVEVLLAALRKARALEIAATAAKKVKL